MLRKYHTVVKFSKNTCAIAEFVKTNGMNLQRM